MVLDPPEFSPDAFLEDAKNLFQINVQGRILQLEFEAAPGLISTEDLRVPYSSTRRPRIRRGTAGSQPHPTGSSSIPWKGQEVWRFFHARTYRSGPFDQEYLMSLMEQLI